MRKLLVLILFLSLSGLTVSPASAIGKTVPASHQGNLRSYVGKYPSELFKNVPSLKTRLRSLLGANYAVFMQRLQTEMPIEEDGGAIVGHGCMAHSCGSDEAVFVINLADNKLHVGILSEKFGGKFRIFSEDKANIPDALKHATHQ